MTDAAAFERRIVLHPRPATAICVWQGACAAIGVDIFETIGRSGPHLRFVQVRGLRGPREHCAETFHDEGPTDVPGAMPACRDAGLQGVLGTDHVPLLAREAGESGRAMLRCLFAAGGLDGLVAAVEQVA